MNYYKRYMGDYQRDTGHLSLAAHGAFTVLLDHYYSTKKPLPASLEDLYRLCRAMSRQEQTAVRTVAEEFFPVDEDTLRHNRRADEEIVKWEQMAEENREKGKLGGRPKKNPAANPYGNPLGLQNGTQTEPESKPPQNPLQLQLHSHIPIPDPEPRSESEVDRRGQVKKTPREPVKAAQLLASPGNGKHAGENGTAESAEAATLRRVVLDELSRGASAESIIRLMPGRGLTVEHIDQIQRESAS